MDRKQAVTHLNALDRFGTEAQVDVLRTLGLYPVAPEVNSEMLFDQFSQAVQRLPARGRAHVLKDLFGYNAAPAVNLLTKEASDVRFYLGELIDGGKSVRLADGSHSDRKGVEQALYLFRSMNLAPGREFVCVEVTPVTAVAHGANEEAIASCRSMVQAVRGED